MAEQLRPGDRDSREATPALRQGCKTNCDGVTNPSGRTTVSFSDAKCRASHPHHCPGTCCSHCTNVYCNLPRGSLYFKNGKHQVQFRLVDGHILCKACASFRYKHGTCRSEAAESALRAAHALRGTASLIVMNEIRSLSRPLRPSSRADPEWELSKKMGESASCELSALLSSVCVTC